jgi:predicted MFS family arabinose efflux permease
MKENNGDSSDDKNHHSINNIQNNINNYNSNKSQDERIKSLNQYINFTLDNIGFTKYHILLFTTNAILLFCEGMNEIIHIILLSLIDEKHKLSHYHLAFMNSIELFGYSLSTLLVSSITSIMKRKYAILISVFLSLLCTGLSISSFNFIFASFNRFILGFCFGILDLLIYLNLFESIPTKIRGFVSTMILLYFPLGEFTLSLICYFQLKEGEIELNYKFMVLFPFIFTTIICISAIFVQESPRDLFFGKHQYDKGAESFRNISDFNKDNENKNKFNFGESEIDNKLKNIKIELSNISPKNSKENIIDNINNINNNICNNENNNVQNSLLKNDTDSNMLKMSKFKILFNNNYFKYTCLFWLLSSFAGFVFNGIHFMLPATAPKINKKTFLDLVLFESMEIPPNFFAMLLIENKELGRTQTIRYGFFITFIISLINIYIGESILLFDCILKFSLTIPLNVLIVYCSEIYDSHVRTLGLSLMNFWRKIISFFSPFFMSFILYRYGEFSTHLYYAPLLAVCALGSLFLTVETRGQALDEVVGVNYN